MDTEPEFAEPRYGVVILSAGASRRMGSPKALLPWGEETVLEHVLNAWRAAGAVQIAVVYDPANEAVIGELDRLGVVDRIANDRAEEGMMSSLRAAAWWEGWGGELSLIAVSLVDQPRIKVETMRKLARFAASAQGSEVIAQPVLEGKRGHPVFFSAKVFREIGRTEAEHLKEFIHQREALRVLMPTNDEGTVADMDTPARYQELLRAEFGSRSSECR